MTRARSGVPTSSARGGEEGGTPITLPHSYIKNYLHVVFSTKRRRKLISPEMRPRLWAYMGGIARNEGIPLLIAGGMDDHMHLLFCLPPSIALSKAMVVFKAGVPSKRRCCDCWGEKQIHQDG